MNLDKTNVKKSIDANIGDVQNILIGINSYVNTNEDTEKEAFDFSVYNASQIVLSNLDMIYEDFMENDGI